MTCGDDVCTTPEFRSVLRHVACNQDVERWAETVPFVKASIPELTSNQKDSLIAMLASEGGGPALIRDALAAGNWGVDGNLLELDSLLRAAPDARVLVNNRAPARHADALPGGGGAQQSKALTLANYIEYVHQQPLSLAGWLERPEPPAPFYLNGWRAFVEVPSLQNQDFHPRFAAPLDDTVTLLKALDEQLFAPPGGGDSAWCRAVDANLSKVFIGPPGTVTRLHYDAGDAHGWLAQLTGRKLFVLYPPSDAPHLAPLATEKETAQSPIDPLDPDIERWPEYEHAHPVACVLHPGEAVLIPKGWWHYAVALDRSVTLQRNFYNAGSNASGLVHMVLKTAAALKQARMQ